MGLKKAVTFDKEAVTSHQAMPSRLKSMICQVIMWLPEEDIEPKFKGTYASEQRELSR